MKSLNEQVIKRCLQQIKSQLKAKELQYKDVALMMGVSEVTIKRMLNQTDIGLDRLLTLAEISGANLGELINTAQQRPKHHFFTDKQDEVFDQRPYLLSYFSDLFFLGKKPEEIATENQLNEISTYLYLRALENIGLLELYPENKFRFLVKPPLGFTSNSRVLKKQITQYIKKACEVVLSPEKTPSHFMMVKPLHLPEEIYHKMRDELISVIDKYAELAEQMVNQVKAYPDYQITLVGNPLDTQDFEQAPIVNINEESFS